jgi:hypothetical protein
MGKYKDYNCFQFLIVAKVSKWIEKQRLRNIFKRVVRVIRSRNKTSECSWLELKVSKRSVTENAKIAGLKMFTSFLDAEVIIHHEFTTNNSL